MALGCTELHQSVFTVSGVQGEGLPYKYGSRNNPEADTYPLVYPYHVEDDEEDEQDQQPANEDEEVLCLQSLELHRTTDSLVYGIISHYLTILQEE